MSLLDRLRELIATAEDDAEVETDDGDEIEIETDDDEVEIETDDGDEVEIETDDGDEIKTDDGDEIEIEDEGTEPDDAEEADLRATILEQASQIESLKNRIAELGGEEVAAELDVDGDGDINDEDVDAVEAFDVDYDVRKARLDELIEGN